MQFTSLNQKFLYYESVRCCWWGGRSSRKPICRAEDMMEILNLLSPPNIVYFIYGIWSIISASRSQYLSPSGENLHIPKVGMHWFCCDTNLLEIAQVALGIGLHRMTTPSPLGAMPDNTAWHPSKTVEDLSWLHLNTFIKLDRCLCTHVQHYNGRKFKIQGDRSVENLMK